MTLLIMGRLIRKDAWECTLHLASGLTVTHVGAAESGGKRCMRAAEGTLSYLNQIQGGK